jgi:hypothetical protein
VRNRFIAELSRHTAECQVCAASSASFSALSRFPSGGTNQGREMLIASCNHMAFNPARPLCHGVGQHGESNLFRGGRRRSNGAGYNTRNRCAPKARRTRRYGPDQASARRSLRAAVAGRTTAGARRPWKGRNISWLLPHLSASSLRAHQGSGPLPPCGLSILVGLTVAMELVARSSHQGPLPPSQRLAHVQGGNQYPSSRGD